MARWRRCWHRFVGLSQERIARNRGGKATTDYTQGRLTDEARDHSRNYTNLTDAISTDEKGNLVAQSLLLQEPFTGNHFEQVLGTGAPIILCAHNYPPFPGKTRKSAGLFSSISRFMRPDNQIG